MTRRALVAEGLGSMLLASTVIGSGIMAERLAGGNLAVALLANTAATVAVLATLIALLGPISGAHFNPAVSIIQSLRGKLTLSESVGYVIVQIIGCCLGALLAHAMFELPLIQASAHMRTGPALSNTFAGIAPSNAPAFIASQLCGALVGLLLGRWLFG
jgi:glycerol uptake facilitator-like aquaporin